MSASWFHCHPPAESKGQEIQGGEHRPPPAPSWWPEFSLAFGAHSVQTRFPGRCWGKRCQRYLPCHFPLPQICGTSLFSHHVTALCHSGACTQTGQILFKWPCEKDAARSDLHIYSDHDSLLGLARRGFLPLPQLPMQCWRRICQVTSLLWWKDVRIIRSPQRRRIGTTIQLTSHVPSS